MRHYPTPAPKHNPPSSSFSSRTIRSIKMLLFKNVSYHLINDSRKFCNINTFVFPFGRCYGFGRLPYRSKYVPEVVVINFPLSISFVSLNTTYQTIVILSKYMIKDVLVPFLIGLLIFNTYQVYMVFLNLKYLQLTKYSD